MSSVRNPPLRRTAELVLLDAIVRRLSPAVAKAHGIAVRAETPSHPHPGVVELGSAPAVARVALSGVPPEAVGVWDCASGEDIALLRAAQVAQLLATAARLERATTDLARVLVIGWSDAEIVQLGRTPSAGV